MKTEAGGATAGDARGGPGALLAREVHVDDEFMPYLEAALARFAYLYPGSSVERGPPLSVAVAEGGDIDAAVRDFRFVLYRQKIYADTFAVREAIVKGVMGR
ncbi:hypothetical protein AB3G45_03730 [Shinella sp. S4-D37]|uniref:hypothetical protein n=1 Tax=Shinella sp. S4-D37 TaxID=3161999 RepID=UPI00346746F6